MEVNGCYRMKINSEALAILILTVFAFILFDTIAVCINKDSKCLELTFFLYIVLVDCHLQPVSILFNP